MCDVVATCTYPLSSAQQLACLGTVGISSEVLPGKLQRRGGVQDPRLPQLLEALRASGRKLFLATNSLWDYTHVVMNFLLAGRTGSQRNMDWLEYFDAVITGMWQHRQPPRHLLNTFKRSLVL